MKKSFLLLSLAFLASCGKDDNPDPTPSTPDRIEVYKITVKSFPSTDVGGSSWDVFDGADIYPILRIGTTELVNLQSQRYANATSGSFTWQVSGVFMENPSATYSIALFDYDDTSSDDFMGGIDFVPWSEGNGTPSTITLGGCAGCNTSWTLEVDYHF